MTRHVLLVAFLTAVCPGLMCLPGLDFAFPTPDAGSQIGIPEGVYTGTTTISVTMTSSGLIGPVGSSIGPLTLEQAFAFATDGSPLRLDGTPVTPGSSYTYEFENQQVLTVESVSTDWGVVIVTENAIWEMPTPEQGEGATVQMTGPRQTTFTDLGTGRIRYKCEMHLTGEIIEGQSMVLDWTETGLLRL